MLSSTSREVMGVLVFYLPGREKGAMASRFYLDIYLPRVNM